MKWRLKYHQSTRSDDGDTDAAIFYDLWLQGIPVKAYSEEENNAFSEQDEWYLRAFYQLTYSRPTDGMGGIGFIPCSEILNYAKYMGVIDYDKFLTVMQACDAVYLENEISKRNKAQEDSQAKSIEGM